PDLSANPRAAPSPSGLEPVYTFNEPSEAASLIYLGSANPKKT
ncbi:hypothetical protein BV898_19838, partial [Hypsibius exemplaris]